MPQCGKTPASPRTLPLLADSVPAT